MRLVFLHFALACFCFVGACAMNEAKAEPPPAKQVQAASLPSELAPWRQPDWVPYRDLLIARCLNPGPEYNTAETRACGEALQTLADMYKGVAAHLELEEMESSASAPPSTEERPTAPFLIIDNGR